MLGDFMSSFGLSGKGPISFGDIANGYWTGAASVDLSAGHNFQLQSDSYTVSL